MPAPITITQFEPTMGLYNGKVFSITYLGLNSENKAYFAYQNGLGTVIITLDSIIPPTKTICTQDMNSIDFSCSQELSITNVTPTEMTFDLIPPDPTTTGGVCIKSNPTGIIAIDNNPKMLMTILPGDTCTDDSTIKGLSAGNHTYEITASGYQPATGTFNITVGQTTTIDLGNLTPITPTIGDVCLISYPPGASISIDGTPTGKTTLITEACTSSYMISLDPATNPHSYELTLPGYQPVTDTLNVTAGTFTGIYKELVPIVPYTGSLIFKTNPPGASVYIENTLQGISDPTTGILKIDNITTGTPIDIEGSPFLILNYTIKKAGYNDFNGTAGVSNDYGPTAPTFTKLPIYVSVTLSSTKGYLYISSTHLGAEIYIDGIDQKSMTPMIIPDLSPGPHHYKLTLPKYKDEIGTFDIVSNQITVVYKELIKLSIGCQPFSSVPIKAEIFIDDMDMLVKTPKSICYLPLGEHIFRLDGTFIIPPLPRSSCVFFDSVPRGAKIFIDGVDTGKVTPSRICNLTPGTHTFSIRGTVKIVR